MKEADILKALDRAEALLKDADGKMFMVSADTATVDGLDAIRADLGDAQHSVNNARQIVAGLKVLLDRPSSESKDLQDAFMEGFSYAEDIGHTTSKKLAAEAMRRYSYGPHSLPSESVEPPEPDLLGHDYREDIKR